MMGDRVGCDVLLISGSLRAGSTNVAVASTWASLAPDGDTTTFRGVA